MSLFSYHVFMFPFQWELKSCAGKPFNERFDLTNIRTQSDSMWENLPFPKNTEYETELYNEKNFFYKFVHQVLYDKNLEQPVIRHYERKEAYKTELAYEIGVKAYGISKYELKLKSIGLDLFSTGTGILVFYVENNKYKDFGDVKRINQFGRRVFPPYMVQGSGSEGTKNSELADYISIVGLNGDPSRFYEDFSKWKSTDDWKPARFIRSLMEDLDVNITMDPVVDDRMFTMCWYFNNIMSGRISDEKRYYEFIRSNDWHEYLYIDSNGTTCQNQRMQKKLLEAHTYERWQKEGTLYGVTRHSFMAVSNDGFFAQNGLLTYFRTEYVRLAELVLVQLSSVLKFSGEVASLSSLPNKKPQKLARDIGKFYRAYIRFVNQIYFREVTAQEQGIELYDLLQENFHMKEQVKDLDNEISELHDYANMLDEKVQSDNLSLLTILGSMFLVPSFIVGFFGMNLIPEKIEKIPVLLPMVIVLLVLLGAGLLGVVRLNKCENKLPVFFLLGTIILLILGALVSTLYFRL